MLLVSTSEGVLTARTRFPLSGKNLRTGRHQLGMSTFQTRHARPCRLDGPPVDVVEWRRCRLTEAGFSLPLAAALSRTRDVDVHALLQLVDRGCPPELAARIVAALDAPA